MGQELYGVVDHFTCKKTLQNTKFKYKLDRPGGIYYYREDKAPLHKEFALSVYMFLQVTLFFYNYEYPKLPKWHLWTCAWNPKFFWPKDFFWGIMKVPYTKNIHNLFQAPPNPGFRSVKVQTETFKKALTGFQKFFLFRVPMNP